MGLSVIKILDTRVENSGVKRQYCLTRCPICGIEFKTTINRVSKISSCKDCARQKRRKYDNSALGNMYNAYKRSAKDRGYNFELSYKTYQESSQTKSIPHSANVLASISSWL